MVGGRVQGMDGWVDGWAEGWVVSEGYEAYEVKKKRGNLRCLILRRKKFFFKYL